MKKIYLLICMIAAISDVHAQGVSRMFGLVGGYPQGDQSSNGYLFSTDNTGNNFQQQYNFPVTTFGANPANVELALYNGKLYGTTYQGGTSNLGTIFEYDPVTNIYTKKFDFGTAPSTNGYNPKGGLQLYNSKFYGLANAGGAGGTGTIFEWDAATNTFTKKFDFISSTGTGPQNSLRLNNNKMYGTTLQGGSNNLGVVFQWDPSTNAYTDLLDLTGTGAGNGSNFYGNVTVYNNKLYCMSVQGAVSNYGALYAIDPSLPNGSNTTIIKIFDGTSGGGGNNNEMIVYNNKLFGCTSAGGVNSAGVLFQVDPSTNTYTKLVDFNYANTGSVPLGRLVPNGGKFLGVCNSGGVNNTGTIFEWDPASPGTVLKKYDFGANNFDNPIQPGIAMFLYNSKFYGTTYNGGFVDQGTLFEYDATANILSKKLNFNAAENGRIPYGRPTLLNGKIYGTSYTGPQEIYGTAYGTIWEFDPSASVYSRKFLFSNANNTANGRSPLASPVAYNGKLYGLTNAGGVSDYGVAYEFDPATNAYVKTDIQTLGTGSHPDGELTMYNNKFYGMLGNGGIGNLGIIFSYDPVSHVLAKLYDISNLGSSNSDPASYFTMYNGKLYGCTNGGGANSNGTIFSFDPATNTAVSLADINSAVTGSNVRNAFAVYNNKLYNTALSGGGGRGAIFSFDPATNTVSNVYTFPNTSGGNGYDPKGQLTLNGNKMYTTTVEGGDITKVVEFDPVANTVALTSSYSSSNYNLTVSHNGITVLPAFIANGIPNSCETYPTFIINGSNNNQWVPILNNTGDIVAEIKANGNNLGNVNASAYINSGAVREDGRHQLYLDRNITISVQNPPAGNVDLRLYIKTSEYLALKNAINSMSQPSGISSINDLAIFKNQQNCPAEITENAYRLTTTNENYEYGYILKTSVSSFSTFSFAKNTFSVLPVNLISFNAVKQYSSVKLNWVTENELNFSRYEVEKSVDGTNYKSIAILNTNGNALQNNYNTIDVNPNMGINYYRLKMIEKNGEYSYSYVVKIDFGKKYAITMLPNPAKDYIIITGADAFMQIQIIDAAGKIVKQMNKKSDNRYSLNGLNKGIYFIRLSGDSDAVTNKIIIE